jgi:BASS family bile acid:Na+ symporter|tara:strand:- start:513 stop:1391 length:879 start_codon:yes stop_codon:yes gene_type:complete
MDVFRLTAPAIILSLIAGLLFPGFKILSPTIIPFIGFLIFVSSLSINLGNLQDSLKKPKPYLTLFLILFLLQPLATYFIARIFITNPLILAGLVLAASAPAPAALIYWTRAVKGHIALAISFTALSHLLSPIVTPLLSYYLLGAYITVPVMSIAKTLGLTIIIPLALALILQKVKNIEKISAPVSIPVYFLLLATVVARSVPALSNTSNLLVVGIMVFFQCVFSFTLAWFFSRKWEQRDREPLIMGTVVRNNVLLMAIAFAVFGELAALPCVVGFFMQLVFVSIYLYIKKQN